MSLRATNSAAIGIAALAFAFGCGRPSDSVPTPGKSSGEPTVSRRADSKAPANPMAADPNSGKPKVDPTKPPAFPKMPEPRPEAFAISKTGDGKWTKAKIGPLDLAERIGNAMRGMKSTYGESRSTIKTPSENGTVKNAIKVQDYKTYSIQTLRLSEMPGVIEMRADGSKKSATGENGTFAPSRPLSVPAPETSLSPKQLVERWPREFPRLAFAGLTDGKDSWKPYVQELMSGRSGFKGEISERSMPYKGKQFLNYRVVAKRTPEAAKRLGNCEIEMVFDGKLYLPVTIRVNMTEPKGGTWNILWQTGWNFNKKFDAKDFSLPN